MPTSRLLYVAAIALIALHVIDDSFLQPQPGTSAGDHLASGLVPLALLALAALAPHRVRRVLALPLGFLGIAGGAEAVHYARETGLSGDDYSGLLSLAAGVTLAGVGIAELWRGRRTDGPRLRRYPRRALFGTWMVIGVAIAGLVGYAYVAVHVARGEVPAELGVAHEDVRFTTSDGLELEGWYVPSRNGAAVISFPGRKGPQPHARMLARHGYGVLLFDRRGEGASEGDPNSWGWGGDRDVKAAIAWLRRRPDVDPGRIGGLGLSVGGELLLETAADTDALAAVVSDGAGPRAYAEDVDRPGAGVGMAIGSAIKTAAVSVFANQPPPSNLRTLAGRITEPVLLIAAPHSPNGEELNRGYHDALRGPKSLWEIPEAEHTGGLAARPAEYERRVVGFFDRALG